MNEVRIMSTSKQFQISCLVFFVLRSQSFHFLSSKPVTLVALVSSGYQIFFMSQHTLFVLNVLSVTLQMTTRLQLIQDTQSASPVRHLRPISELGCIPHLRDGALPESSVGPTRACRLAQCRFYSLFKNSPFLKKKVRNERSKLEFVSTTSGYYLLHYVTS